MTFGLKNAPPTFQKWIQEVFGPFLTSFMRVFLDDFSVFGKVIDHLHHLRLCFEKCRSAGLALNPSKCAFAVNRGILLGQVVSKEGIQIDARRIAAILDAPVPKNVKQVARFVSQIKWHNRYLRYLSHVCQPLTYLTKKKSVFVWGEDQDRSFRLLKRMLVIAPILQPLIGI